MNTHVTSAPTRSAPRSAPRHDAAPAIRLRSIVRSYAGVHAVRGIDLDFAAGETVALLGPNGAGKSTSIGMMLGLITPDSGQVTVGGLSGGQSQRLRFAIAIVANPQILILDEPTRALDVQGRAEFWIAMRAYASTGRTILFATHYLDEVDENATRVVVLSHGSVVADGNPADIRSRTGVSVVRVSIRGGSAACANLPGVIDANAIGERVALRTTDPDATVRALAARDLDWWGIQVSPPSLDESFLNLTNDSFTQENTGSQELS
ncbi:MAG TPA: ATP-binding cassette domain-containing protein [Microbacteriaceae bacterium]